MRESEERQRQGARASRHARGYTNSWSKASRSYLRQHPLCVKHLEREISKASKVTDHIVPHKGDMDLFWDESNWQALCKQCHDIKTATEDGGFGNQSSSFKQRGRIAQDST